MPFCILLIPVYNHASKIGAVLDGCLQFLGPDNILVVDDGSTDFSSAEAGKRLVHIRRHEKNMGKGRALITGFNWAIQKDAEWVLTLDADGQHLPNEIPLFLEAAKRNQADFLIGKREIAIKKMPIHRVFSNFATSKTLSFFTRRNILDSQCGFRMIRVELLKQMDLRANDYLLETEMILFASGLNATIEFIPVSTVYRDEKSHMKNVFVILRFIKTIWQNRKLYRELMKKPKAIMNISKPNQKSF
jgi:glycosyltransferase involved in cell wall biosynthesis